MQHGYDWDVPPSATGAPPRLRVATCQFPASHDIAANARQIVALLRRAADAGADVAHFPECALSGYGGPDWPRWEGYDWAALAAATARVRAAARRHRIWAVVGSCHREHPAAAPTNCVRVFDRDGAEAARYDKRRCSLPDLQAFRPGRAPVVLDIGGVRCGLMICLDFAFPELWQDYAERGVELVFLSAHSDGAGPLRDRNHAHTIPPLMQSYAFLHSYAISVSNSALVRQDFPSLWVERSGHKGAACQRDATGFVVSAVPDDPAQDAFFARLKSFRQAVRDGRPYREQAGRPSETAGRSPRGAPVSRGTAG